MYEIPYYVVLCMQFRIMQCYVCNSVLCSAMYVKSPLHAGTGRDVAKVARAPAQHARRVTAAAPRVRLGGTVHTVFVTASVLVTTQSKSLSLEISTCQWICWLRKNTPPIPVTTATVQ